MEVTEILKEQMAIFTHLSQLLERENSLLAKQERKPQDLKLLIEEKNEVAHQLVAVEDKRVLVMGDMTIAEFAQAGDPSLINLVSDYQKIVAKVAELTKTNEILIELGVEFYRDVLNTISESAKEKVNTYGQGGQMNATNVQGSPLFNKKV